MAMPSFIDPATGQEYFLGNNEQPGGLTKAWPVFGDSPETPMIHRSEWDALIPNNDGPDDPFLGYVHDQDGIGMCNASAVAACMEDQRAIQGLEFIALSGGDLYHRISGGRDQGSMLEDGLTAAMSVGIASTAVVPYLDWTRNHSGAPADRKRFRVLEAFLCPTFEHCMSAVLQKRRLISGVMWFNNYTPDQDGWLPNGRGNGGGHAVRGYKPAKRNGKYGIWHRNSWTKSWGLNGNCVFPEASYGGAIGGWWAVRSVVDEGGVVPPMA